MNVISLIYRFLNSGTTKPFIKTLQTFCGFQKGLVLNTDKVGKYINNQESHHKKISFKEEYLVFLNKYQVEYSEQFLFEFYE